MKRIDRLTMSDKKQHEGAGAKKPSGEGKDVPEWASGLRQLYDSVVEEPLPDSFKDLLEQFDERDHTDRQDESGGQGQGVRHDGASPARGKSGS